ncbi:MAG: restriction endonuclease [bacterium]
MPLDLHLPKALAEFLEERREWIDGLEEKHLSLLGPEGPDWQEFSDFLNRELERAGIRKGVLLLKRPHRVSPDLARMLALSHHLQRKWDTHQGWLEDWSRTAGPQWSEAIPGELVRVFGDRYESLLAYVEWFGITRGVHLSMKRIRKQAQAIFLEQQDALRASSLSSHSQGIGVTIQDVDAMDPFDFEVFLGKLFTNLGYTITETPKTGDQGADVLLEKNGSSTVIQAKLYTSPVGNKAVQEAHAAKAHFHCDSAQVITNNTFTRSAQELAGTTGVQLVSREGLTALLEGYNAALQYRQVPVPAA